MSKRNYINKESEAAYRKIIGDLSFLPFGFVYDGIQYIGFPPKNFPVLKKKSFVKENKETNILTVNIDKEICVEIVTAFYPNYGAYEWTVWFENVGSKNSGVISDVRSADIKIQGSNPVLRGILGDLGGFYAPYEKNILHENISFISDTGRPTHVNFPYFNLEHGDGGTLIALGWGGTWEADFSYADGCTHVKAAGVNGLKTYLKPGEKIRTALVLMIPYINRNEHFASNLWRSWFIAHNMPKRSSKGESIEPFTTSCLSNDTGLPNSDGSISERFFTWKPSMEKIISEDIKINYRWFDAGWYFDPHGNTVETQWWDTIGSWELDTIKWPEKTFRESVEWAHEKGIKTLVWFEPERVTNVDGLVKNYGYNPKWALSYNGHSITNNLGDPDCLAWTLNRITKFLCENEVDLFREDNNSEHMKNWRGLDADEGENRTGITECKAINGHYELWDGIIKFLGDNGKDTFVDSCASGGGRNDLESMRRGVPFLRSDSDRTTTSLRLSMQTSFNNWIPFCGCASVEQQEQLEPNGKRDKYIFRASYNPIMHFSAQWVHDPDTDFNILRFGQSEWNSLKKYLLKEFYVLTKWNSREDKTNWTSYIYYDPEDESGVLFTFRMEEAKKSSLDIKLEMFNKNIQYEIIDADTKKSFLANGSKLAEGLTVTHEQARTAGLFYIMPVI